VSTTPAFKRAEPDARRLSLIEACARVLARDGASGASVRAIALEAGVSPGLIGHYFASIDALYAATYEEVETRTNAALDAARDAAGTDPRTRLEAFVTASLAAPIATGELLATWIAFWSLVRTRPAIASQHDAQYGSFRERLEELLGNCGLPLAKRRQSAIAIAALVDGLWLELCLSPHTFAPGEAAEIARAELGRIISTGR
jgi:AcrR family transcriptional regulator